MTEEFRRLWKALKRHRRTPPASYRVPSWYDKVDVMSRIDEVIQIANGDDRYGEPHIFEEADADGRWALYVAEVHERRRALGHARALEHVWDLGEHIAASQRCPLADGLAPGGPDNAVDGADDAVIGFDQGETAQTWGSSFLPESIAHLSGPQSRTRSSSNGRRPILRDTPNGHSDVAERNKENQRVPQSCFDETNGNAVETDSSDDDDDIDADADDAQQERVFQLFEDFPTCIQKARHLPTIDSGNHGIMIISNPVSGWSHIDPERLPPRVQKYLADFTHLDAAAFPDVVHPNEALNGGDSHRWLLSTARQEFICDTSTLDVWRLIYKRRDFRDGHGPRIQANFRAIPARRRQVRGPRALPRCNWQFWDEPDDTNHGPQIIVTEPDGGDSHYLIGLDTYRLKVRQRRERRSGQAASHVEKSTVSARMEAMARFSVEDMEMYGDDDDEDSALSSYTPGPGTRWWMRWGRMLLRSGAQPRSLLPLYQNNSPFDPEKVELLGYDGAQDEKPCGDGVGAARSPGIVGTLRNLACCCSKP